MGWRVDYERGRNERVRLEKTRRTRREVDETNLDVGDDLLRLLESRLLLVGEDGGKIVVGFGEVLLSGGGERRSVLLLREREMKSETSARVGRASEGKKTRTNLKLGELVNESLRESVELGLTVSGDVVHLLDSSGVGS